MRSALAGALAAVLICSPVFAAGPSSSDPVAREQQKKIDALSKQLQQMQQQQQELMSQLKELKDQMKIPVAAASPGASPGAEVSPVAAASPAASPSPGTLGEHVGAVETDLAQTKGDLQKNLGIVVHGLVDASYEHNF